MSKHKDVKYLIIPDVHARDFWVEPVYEVLKNSDAHIVFLGDYLDPYPFEWEGVRVQDENGEWHDVDYKRLAIERFKEIINLKKANPDRITLLLGNHDGGYCIDFNVCTCRMDHKNAFEIGHLFTDNRELFQIGKRIRVGDKEFDLTHSGILKGWAKSVWGDEANDPDFNVIDRLNNAWLIEDYTILDHLADYDNFRGWGGYEYGSPVWADIRSWWTKQPEDTYRYNIVGHTMSRAALGFSTIMNLDCQKAFYIDGEGAVREYKTDEKVKIIDTTRKDGQA